MRITILRMISTGSLSAFSASVAQTRLGNVQAVRALGTQPQPKSLQSAPAVPAPPPPQGEGQFLPRGSLLDLSV